MSAKCLPPGVYSVVTDEELIEGLSFSAYHRISTLMFVPAQSGSAVEMVTIEPLDLEAAFEQKNNIPGKRIGRAVPPLKIEECRSGDYRIAVG